MDEPLWDELIRDYSLLIAAGKRVGMNVNKYDKVTDALKSITRLVDGKYVQTSIDKNKREKENQHLQKINRMLMMKVQAAASIGQPSKGVLEGLGVAGPPKVPTTPVQSTPSKISRFGAVGKLAILGVGTLSVCWVIGRMRKKNAMSQPNEEKTRVIRERIIERIPATRERIIEKSKKVSVDEIQEPDDDIVEEIVVDDEIAEST